MATILVVEDDRALSAALAEALENAGHEVVVSQGPRHVQLDTLKPSPGRSITSYDHTVTRY